ncbi:MAG: hypothetical protein HFI38_13640 [Lachnospiraceae bacterium]|nr:hypothetical protein [Lachnospiraceae bacterium]
MKITKKVIARLTKCYSIAPLYYHGQECILVAAEKKDPCLLFDREGNLLDTVWEGPGGTMSMVQIPGSDGMFLATQKFYSPNDSKEAEIVLAAPRQEGGWKVQTLLRLPHVHRFDILRRNQVNYLIACTIKSGHDYRDDWTMPGKVYGAVLPKDIGAFDEEHPLTMQVIKDDLLKNHGYYRISEAGEDSCVICAASGIFRFCPPSVPSGKWEVERLLDIPASDAVLVDFDGDGEKELAVLSPFHGERICIYKKRGPGWEPVYVYGKPAEFCHAIYGGPLCGRPSLIVGHRKGERNLIAFWWDESSAGYGFQVLDEDCGPANVFHYEKDGKDIVISANRETDEVAMYTLTRETGGDNHVRGTETGSI